MVSLVYMRVESILEADTKELRRKIWCCLCTSGGEEGDGRKEPPIFDFPMLLCQISQLELLGQTSSIVR